MNLKDFHLSFVLPCFLVFFFCFGSLGIFWAQENVEEIEPVLLDADDLGEGVEIEPLDVVDFILTQEELNAQEGVNEADKKEGEVSADEPSSMAENVAQAGLKTRQAPHIIFVLAKNHSALASSSYLDVTQSWLAPAHEYAAFTPFLSRLAKGGVQFNSAWATGWDEAACYRGLLSGSHPASTQSGVRSLAQELSKFGYETAAFGHWAERSMPSERGFGYWEITQGENRLLNPVYLGSQGRKIEQGHEAELTINKLIAWLEGKAIDGQNQEQGRPLFVLCEFESPGKWPLGTRSDYWGPELLLDAQNKWQWHPVIPAQLAIANEQGEELDNELSAENVSFRFRGSEIGEGGAVRLGKEFAEQKRGYYLSSTQERWPGSLARVTREEQKQELFGGIMRANNLRTQAQAAGFDLMGAELQRWQQQRYVRSYLSGVRTVDFALSRLVKALAEQGMLENTLLIYTSAQGTELGEGEGGWIGGSVAGREAGLRVPMVWYWPEGLPAGVEVEEPVQSIDVGASILEIVGKLSKQGAASEPERKQGQGSSLLPLVFADADADEQSAEVAAFRERRLYFADTLQGRWEGALVKGKFLLRVQASEARNSEGDLDDGLDDGLGEDFWQQLRKEWNP